MAVKTFEEIYSGLSAQEKTIIDNLFAKEPELKGGWTRHDDYSRKTQELAAKRTEYEEAVAYKEKMEPWANTAYERLHSLEEAGVLDPEGRVLWTDQKEELEQQLKDAKALGGDMDPKVLEDLVTKKVQEIAKNAGGLTKEEAAALYASESKKLVEDGFKEREERFNRETIPFVAGFSGANAVVAMHYEQESGEKWTAEKQKEFYELMSKEGKFDPYALEEKLLSPIREKKSRAEEIQREAERIAKEKYGSSGMPGGGGERYIPTTPAENPIGLLQKAMAESADKGLPDVRDSVMAGVIEGAKELVEAGNR